jgi:hypothetical protein
MSPPFLLILNSLLKFFSHVPLRLFKLMVEGNLFLSNVFSPLMKFPIVKLVLTHHQNGSVERRHRHLVHIGLALLAHSNVPFTHGDDSFETAFYLINCLPTISRPKSPFELLFHKIPDYKFLKTFGYECWPYLRPYNSHKFSYRSKSCLFLG